MPDTSSMTIYFASFLLNMRSAFELTANPKIIKNKVKIICKGVLPFIRKNINTPAKLAKVPGIRGRYPR